MTPFSPSPRLSGPPLIIAHRGLSGKAPENTVASFVKALSVPGIAMLELDVRLSRDDHVIVLHDRTLQRTTTGNGRARAYDLQELKQLDAGSWFDPEFRRETIPQLSEVLSLARGRCWVNIELKSSPFWEARGLLENRVLESVHNAGMADQVMYSSFDRRLVSSLKRLHPSAPTGVIYNLYRDFLRSPSALALGCGASVFVCAKHELKPPMVEDAHRHGIAIYVYTLNSVAEAVRIAGLGVDGIISDNADELVPVLRARDQNSAGDL